MHTDVQVQHCYTLAARLAQLWQWARAPGKGVVGNPKPCTGLGMLTAVPRMGQAVGAHLSSAAGSACGACLASVLKAR